ncbi:MAG TPA: type II secretion system protein GspG [Blastocatellia bacterium]|nr:type II secretion system protein GspG [Blastocatellia bacterium]
MKNASRMIFTGLVLLLILGIGVARELGSREARDRIAQALGIGEPGRIHVKSISLTGKNDAVVEATFDGAFHLSADKDGNWSVTEVRTGDRCWESIELIRTAIRKEKILRTTADMRTIAAALEAFHRDHGSYVQGTSGAVLMDNLAPRYIEKLVRTDAWSHEFQYQGGRSGYRLASPGPDGKPGTGDDIVYQNGKQTLGASE